MRFSKAFMPLFVAAGVHDRNQGRFCVEDKLITITAPGSLMRELLEICDGKTTLQEVVSILRKKWDGQILIKLIIELARQGIICDSRSISSWVWPFIENPSRFSHAPSDKIVRKLVEESQRRHQGAKPRLIFSVSKLALRDALMNRRSVRSFSGEPVSRTCIIQMLWAAYGAVAQTKPGTTLRRTTPSAGALYPLCLSLVLFQPTSGLKAGIYRVWLGEVNRVGLELLSNDLATLQRAFLDPLMLERSQGVIVISGSFAIDEAKYGNRSLLFVPIEAGHAAQNALLAAAENHIATVEIGGSTDQLLIETLKLPNGYHPLTTIVFGHENASEQTDKTPDTNIEVQWIAPITANYHLPFAMAIARLSKGASKDWSCGRSVSPSLAHIKATAEAKEWSACGCVPDALVKACYADLEGAIDPRLMAKFHPAQYAMNNFPFKPFNEKRLHAWTEGKDELDGSKRYALADCVYFPYAAKTPRYMHATSSGVAAHPDREQAVKNGVLELIERDAFMIAYLARLSLPTVAEHTVPRNILDRILALKKIGFKLWIKDHSLDLAPSIFVFAQSEELAFTTCSACSRFDIEEALDHALMEVESAIFYRLKNGRQKPINPKKVYSVNDHGRLYGQRRFFRSADFMAHSQNVIDFQDCGPNTARSWHDLIDRFTTKQWELVTVPLHLTSELGGNDRLHIVRSIVPGLVPISFGYMQEPRGMTRISEIARMTNRKSISYKAMPRFPHLYT